MRKLKTFLGAFAVIALLGGIAVAEGPWNLRQLDRGETVFTDQDGVNAGAGDNGIMFTFTNLADAWTRYVPVHRNGVVTKMYVVTEGNLSGTAPSVMTAMQMWSDSIGSIWTNINGLAVTVTGPSAASTGKAGFVNSDTTGTATTPDKNNPSYFVTTGDTIAVRNDGAGATVTEGTVLIIVE